MDPLIIIFICMLLGIGLRAMGVFPDNAAQVLNRFIIYVSLPAIVLQHVHSMDMSALSASDIAGPASMPWLLLFGSWGLIHVIGGALKWHPHTKGALILTAGLGNTSFVGFPLITALHGTQALQTAVLLDQLGSFFAMSTLGIALAIGYSGGKLETRLLLRKLFTFPPFLALCAAFLLKPVAFPPVAYELFHSLGGTLLPLALVAVGMQLQLSKAHLLPNRLHLTIGLGYKLLLAPLVCYALYGLFMDTNALPYRVLVLEAAMAPMVTAGIIATEYKLRGDLAALMVGIGIPLSLLTVPLLDGLLW